MALNLEDWGLNVMRLSAGFGGGVVHALVRRQATPISVVASVVVGTLTANYLGAAAGHYAPVWVGDGAIAFLVGLSAMEICQGVMRLVSARIESLGGAGERKE
jgi:hypothetical protein